MREVDKFCLPLEEILNTFRKEGSQSGGCVFTQVAFSAYKPNKITLKWKSTVTVTNKSRW